MQPAAPSATRDGDVLFLMGYEAGNVEYNNLTKNQAKRGKQVSQK